MNYSMTIATAAEATPAAPAAQNTQGLGSSMSFLVPMIIIFIAMMYISSRSQKKQAKKRQEELAQLKKDDKIITNAGIYGTITEVHDDFFIVEIAEKVKIKIAKAGVARTVAAEDVDPKKLA